MENYIIEFVNNLKILDNDIQEEPLKSAIANCVSRYTNSSDGDSKYIVVEMLCQYIYKKGKLKGQNCNSHTNTTNVCLKNKAVIFAFF